PPLQAAGQGGGRGAAAARPPQPYAGSYPESLVKDVIPFVEKTYRVIANKDNRAVAGLSMGGGHTLMATNNNPGVFGYIGVFSSDKRVRGKPMERRTFLKSILPAAAAAHHLAAQTEWGGPVLDTHLHIRAKADACFTHMQGCGVTNAVLLTPAASQDRARAET